MVETATERGKTYDQKQLPAVSFSVRRELQSDGFFFLLPADGWKLVEGDGIISHEPKVGDGR